MSSVDQIPAYGFQDLVGFRFTDWSAGYCRLELPLGPQHGNRAGIPHGGVLATLADTAMGFSGAWTATPGMRRRVLTLSMNLNFLAQAKGDLLIAEGRRTGGGARIYFAEALVMDQHGTELVRASGSFRLGEEVPVERVGK